MEVKPTVIPKVSGQCDHRHAGKVEMPGESESDLGVFEGVEWQFPVVTAVYRSYCMYRV